MDYYCARLLVVILVNDSKARKRNTYDESVVVFKAQDWEHANVRAVEIGKGQETSYLNGKNQEVRWALVTVEEIKCIGKKINGVEVMSKLSSRTNKHPIPFNQKFDPEEHAPEET